MWPYVPTTPPPLPYVPLPESSSTPSKRVHPRTSLQSPYSQRFQRPVSKRDPCDTESTAPASTLEHYAIRRTTSQGNLRQSLPDRDTVAWGYCRRRSASRTCQDPAEAAIRLTRAQEFNIVIENLVHRLERLELKDTQREDLVCLSLVFGAHSCHVLKHISVPDHVRRDRMQHCSRQCGRIPRCILLSIFQFF